MKTKEEKEKHASYMRAYYKNLSPEKKAEWIKRSNKNQSKKYENHYSAARKCHLKIKYGLTIGDYEDMFFRQKGVCAICKRPSLTKNKRFKNLFIDHNHETGEIRGLLCNNCNLAIGYFEESIEYMKQAIKYVKSFKKF